MNVLDEIVARFRGRIALRAMWLRSLGEPEQNETGMWDDPAHETQWQAKSSKARPLVAEDRALEARRAKLGNAHPMSRLRDVFGLSPAEADVFEAAVAVAADPALRTGLAMLEGSHSAQPLTVEAAARLYGRGKTLLTYPESPLLRWDMVEFHETPGGDRVITADAALVQFLAGRAALSGVLVNRAEFVGAPAPLPSWRMQSAVERVRRPLEMSRPVRVHVIGRPGSGRRSFASALAQFFGMSLLSVNATSDDAVWSRLLVHAQRHAFLFGSAVAWNGEAALRGSWPVGLPLFPLQFLVYQEGDEPAPRTDAVEIHVNIPPARAVERLALWKLYLPAIESWVPHHQNKLARSPATPGEIVSATKRAAQDEPRFVHEALREATRPQLGDLAQVLPASFRWDDLVLPAPLKEQLQDFVHEARYRAAFWENRDARRLFPLGRGLIALFSGPSGTGKTMSAQVLAAALGMELQQMDLASILDKFIGETSKHIRRFFALGRHKNAMLLCDEADALFARRSTEVRDAQDRFANADAAYLLQQVERYPGIAILTTNQKSNIDPAFLRRIRYDLEFPRPQPPERLDIWRKIVGALAGEERLKQLDGELQSLATVVDVTGAQIKTSVLAAIFIAGRRQEPLGAPHLLTALDRELMKDGRSLGSRERQRMLHYAG